MMINYVLQFRAIAMKSIDILKFNFIRSILRHFFRETNFFFLTLGAEKLRCS